MKPDPSEDETVCIEDQAFLARRAAKEQVMSGALHNWQDQISTCCGARIDWKHSVPMLCTKCDRECEVTTGEALVERIRFLSERVGALSELSASNAVEAHKARRERDEARTRVVSLGDILVETENAAQLLRAQIGGGIMALPNHDQLRWPSVDFQTGEGLKRAIEITTNALTTALAREAKLREALESVYLLNGLTILGPGPQDGFVRDQRHAHEIGVNKAFDQAAAIARAALSTTSAEVSI